MTEAVFIKICPLAEIRPAGTLAVEIDGEPICLVRTGDGVFALRDACSHAEIPLSEGEVRDHTVECWLHGSNFDVRTGEPAGPPATEPVPVYPVKIDGDDVFVSLTAAEGS